MSITWLVTCGNNKVSYEGKGKFVELTHFTFGIFICRFTVGNTFFSSRWLLPLVLGFAVWFSDIHLVWVSVTLDIIESFDAESEVWLHMLRVRSDIFWLRFCWRQALLLLDGWLALGKDRFLHPRSSNFCWLPSVDWVGWTWIYDNADLLLGWELSTRVSGAGSTL